MRKVKPLNTLLFLLLLLTPFAGRQLQAQILYGSSPFQDSLWAIDTTNYAIISRLGPTLPGFTITGMNGLAYDPIGHDTYVIMKVSGVSGRVLGKIDLNTGVCTQVGNLGMNFSSITFNSAGQLFGVTGDGQNPNPETLFKINKNDGTSTLEIALGNGADGEVISYNHDDDMFYHWSGNGTVVFEKFPATAPYTPVTNIPTIGTPGGETFGSLYLGNGTFMISNISSNFRHLSTNGTYGAVLSNNPDDLRGPVMPPQFSFAFDTVCVADTVTWAMVNASFTKDTAIYHWGDGTSTTVFPAGPATHAYAAGGNFTTYAILKNDSVGEDTISSAVLRVNALPAVALNPGTDTILCFTDTLAMLGASGGSLQWYLNGAPIVGANGASLVITASGWYNQEKINQNGCRDSAATGVLVAFGDQPVADLGADSTLCDGDSLCIGLNNPSNVTYLWSNGSTLNAECFNISGTYEVAASDSVGCVETDTIMVEFILAPDLNVVVDTSNCPTVVFSANDPNGTSWSWAFGDGDTGSGSTVTHTYASNGSYGASLVASNQCFTVSDSGTVVIDCIIAIDDVFANGISVAPNPSNGTFTLNAQLQVASTLEYAVTDISGRKILGWSSNDLRSDWSERVELQAAPGIYFLTVAAGEGRAVYQIVIQ